MPAFPSSFRICQIVGLTGAAWLSGNIGALSSITVPALIQSQDSAPPGILAKQWRNAYERGKAQNPPIAAAAAASFAYLAYSVRSGTPLSLLVPNHSVQLYIAAAVFTLGIVPFTFLTMIPTNKALLAKAEKTDALVGDKEVRVLLKRWEFLNAIRSSLPLIGAMAGFLAVLG